ncbi:MAG: imidazoleglycerol-phosphate dehydratase, partial [Chloroflexota bacterium]
MRIGEVCRKTRETEVTVRVNLDGEGKTEINTGVGFLDHLLTSFATHSLLDITAKVTGDLKHHCVEDLAIGFGEALNKALDTREGITWFGWAFLVLVESLGFAALYLIKRPYSVIDLKLRGKK